MQRSPKPSAFLLPDERERVAKAIGRAEARTSAELKVHIDRFCWGSLTEKAGRVFHRLGLSRVVHDVCVLMQPRCRDRRVEIATQMPPQPIVLCLP